MKMLSELARFLLRWRVRLQWKEMEKHIATCNKRQCQWWRNHSITEDQDATMFCYKGGKIWERNWDMSFHAETIPD